MIIGDWGRKGSGFQQEVADQMAIQAAIDSSRFVLSTGDNFYNDGVKSIDDEHWQLSFEDVYTQNALSVRWYISLGNHDYKGNVEAQISYGKQNPRWYLPTKYYKEEFTLADSSKALFIFLDTTPLNDNILDQVEISQAKTEPAHQLKWLDDTLTHTQAAWKIVIGHHPLFSVGEKHQNNRTMIGNLRSILERHKVQAYFSGHAHSLQHLIPSGHVNYFISGSGSKVRRVHRNEATVAAESVPGFIAASLTSQKLLVQFVGLEGQMHHEAVVYR